MVSLFPLYSIIHMERFFNLKGQLYAAASELHVSSILVYVQSGVYFRGYICSCQCDV